ncbi:MAG: LA_3696 family protein [Candidatus Binatia bacterium]
MALITVPRPLREKLGNEASDALVSLINQAGNGYKADTIEFVGERFERRLTEEVAKLDHRITEEVSKLDVKLSETKADLLRWMFIFWVGQVGALLGILFAFFRH